MVKVEEHLLNAAPGSGALARVRGFYPSLATSERRLADYVLAHPEKVIYASVTQLADWCDVGEATVIRFCQSVGFKGYQDLKLSLARDLVNPIVNINGEVSPNDDVTTVARKVAMNSVHVINETLKLLEPVQIERAVSMMLGAHKILFCGAGASRLSALEARYRFMRLGLTCEVHLDSDFSIMAAAMLTPRDVAVGFSHSGSNKDTVHCLGTAKEAGAGTICVTNHPKSPITQVCDVVLVTSSPESPLGRGTFRSKMAELLILDTLFTWAATRVGEMAERLNEKTANAVLDKFY